jgi:hypothetical protein
LATPEMQEVVFYLLWHASFLFILAQSDACSYHQNFLIMCCYLNLFVAKLTYTVLLFKRHLSTIVISKPIDLYMLTWSLLPRFQNIRLYSFLERLIFCNTGRIPAWRWRWSDTSSPGSGATTPQRRAGSTPHTTSWTVGQQEP